MSRANKQDTLWGTDAQTWADFQEPFNRPLWEAMLDAAAVGPNTRLLDAGCGGGGASVLAAERGAHVYGLDAAAPLIRIAAERVPNGDFRPGDLEAMPYDDDIFDVAFASLSVMLTPDPAAALREMRRVTKPGGRMIVAVWGTPEECEMRVVLKAVRDTMPSPPPGKGPFSLSEAGVLEALIEQTGATVHDQGAADCPFYYDDFDALWRAQRSAGAIQGAIQAVGEASLREAVRRAVAPFRSPMGRIRLENRFRFVTALC